MIKERLLFIYPKKFTFINTEIKILSDNYELISQDQNWNNKLSLPINFIRQFFFLIFNITKVNTILISFGGYSSYLPSVIGRFFGKKVAIVVHGTDCVSFPEINYGNLRKPLMRWFTRKSYQNADIILPVSESLVYTENNYYSEDTRIFGYTHHLENIKIPYKVIPNGLIIEDWKSDKTSKKPNSFITVMTDNQIKRKGGYLIIDVANKLQNCTFYIAGTNTIEDKEVPENVICLGRLTPNELRQWYNKTRFYLQLSNFEGFGVAICEAMLCECVPIVSNVNFLPTIVDNPKLVLKKRDPDLLVKLINLISEENLEELGQQARSRIVDSFSVKNRQKLLIEELSAENK